MRSLVLALASMFWLSAASAQDAPIPPAEAAGRMTLPEGFQATLFAGEPDITQPIAFSFDDRGRLWVVECLSYPTWQTDGSGHDRVVIFTDRDGDGRFDERRVFMDQGSNLSSIEVGFGGVWLCSAPNLIFVPDADADDVPDGPAQVLLDGWDLTARHNVVNGLIWGPDGWLYGLNGILSNSRVGAPGAPDAERTAMNCGVWRYHPTRRAFEVVAHGTTNPWGLDFDDYGQLFMTNCVIEHLWHVVPGAHFQRMFGQDINEHSYGLLKSCADHIHWAGGHWTSSRGGQGEHSVTGGGHAHSGAMVYLGDNWPAQYRNGLFTCNIHGARVNHDLLERQGSGYVAHHGPDFLFANDPWFRGLAIKYGPDGGVYVSDWTDTGECHDYTEQDIHRPTGRIYKVTYGQIEPQPVDLASLDDAALVQLQLHANDWQVSHARRLLQARATAGTLVAETSLQLLALLREQPDVTRQLRALWSLHAIGAIDEWLTLELLASSEDYVRGWAVQLELEDSQASPAVLKRLAELAKKDPSPRVRLCLASALQRLPLADRWLIAEGLVSHAEDAEDAYLPLMIWYGIEPLAPTDPARALTLAARSKLSLPRRHIARRLAPQLDTVSQWLGQSREADVELDVLIGLQTSLQGRRQLGVPQGWRKAAARLAKSDLPDVREQMLLLGLIFGDPKAFESLRATVANKASDEGLRQRALKALLEQQDLALSPLLEPLLAERAMRRPALRALAAYDSPRTPELVLELYTSLDADERDDAVLTLASRPAYAKALLSAVGRGDVPREDLSVFTARQLQSMQDPDVTKQLEEVWGAVRATSQDKAAQIGKYKTLLASEALASADRSRGRAVFARQCAACHKLFGQGGAVGPELTGAQRTNLDYLLENLVDPSALVGRDYQLTILETKDGRVINGIVAQEDANSLTVVTQNDRLLLPVAEIEARELSKLSLMPEGQLEKLTESEFRDLVSYLSSPEQVALP